MLAYYISGSNNYSIRVEPTGSSNLVLQLQDMYTLVNTSSSISASGRPYTYNPYEGILNWTASITQSIVGEQYRAYITDGTSSIWHGSISVFASQSINKPAYVSQLGVEEVYVSNVTDNEYIIIE
jgi:hypothetical protein